MSAPPKVLVTGGPTRAYLDRVRFLTNYSTGELALRVCESLLEKGAEVHLVSGPCPQPFDRLPLASWHPVETAGEMRDAALEVCRAHHPGFGVFSAAVLDFEPVTREPGKVSSSRSEWTLTLKPTPKILDEIGERFPEMKRLGFKLEWSPAEARQRREFALENMRSKGLAGLVLNYLQAIRGTSHPAYLYYGNQDEVLASNKAEIARWIRDRIFEENEKKSGEPGKL